MTASDAQNMILLEVGASLEGFDIAVLSTNVVSYWNSFADKAYFPRLQYLYTKRSCILAVMGQLRLKINKSLGPINKQLGGYFENISKMYQIVNEEIARIEKQASANSDPSVEKIKTPKSRRFDKDEILFSANPNDPKYRGGDL